MQIGHYNIGRKYPPFIIAEMSGNHNQSLDRALEIVEAAAHAGAHAIKLQTYTADTMTLDTAQDGFYISDESSLWRGRTLYSLYQEAHTPWEWHAPIFQKAKELGLLAFSTPFDATSVDFLEELDVPCYKIASFENTDLHLIQKVAATGKPLIISTGMASLADLDETVRVARKSGAGDIILLKCTSSYPATPESTNLLTIPHMRDLFGCEVGLSDHTLGIGVSVASIVLGATVIERHFTLSRADGGVDSTFSIEPDEMANLASETSRAWMALGMIRYGVSDAEKKSVSFRRSLYITEDVNAGDILTRNNLRAIRPGYGLPPKYLDILLGKKVNKNILTGEPMSWDFIG